MRVTVILGLICWLEESEGFTLPVSKRWPRTAIFLSNAEQQSTADNKIVSESPSPLLPPPSLVAENDSIDLPTSASVVTMMTRETRRVLVEELGYKRAEVDQLRVELALQLVAQRIQRPETGIPEAWIQDDDTNSMMMEKLRRESKYPLKVPLLGISLVLAGKGVSDALITLIKVGIDFPGASLLGEFMGMPMLAIDAVCLAVGGGLGVWTWRTMRD